MNANSETFVVHVAIQECEKMVLDLAKKAQIKAQSGAQSRAQVEALIFNKSPTEVPAKYSDYSNVFSVENATELSEYTRINDHAIELEEGKQPPFKPNYSLRPVELETLKMYIETNLANGFIRLSKSFAEAPIFLDRKPDISFRLCVNYWGLNNIIIKNQYPLLLIGKLLDWLGRTRRFIQLDFTNTYHRIQICENDK